MKLFGNRFTHKKGKKKRGGEIPYLFFRELATLVEHAFGIRVSTSSVHGNISAKLKQLKYALKV